ncbi:unnamed protein product [Closterium sp. NIES-54]
MEEARTRMCMEAEDHLVTFYPSFDMRIRVLHDVISEHYVVPLILLKEAMVDKTRRDAFKRVYTQWKNERGFYIKRTVLEGLGVPMSGLRAAEVHIDTDLKEDLWGEYGPSADAQLSTWGNAEDSDLPFGNEIFFNAAMDAFGEFAVGNGICLKAYHIAWTILVVSGLLSPSTSIAARLPARPPPSLSSPLVAAALPVVAKTVAVRHRRADAFRLATRATDVGEKAEVDGGSAQARVSSWRRRAAAGGKDKTGAQRAQIGCAEARRAAATNGRSISRSSTRNAIPALSGFL